MTLASQEPYRIRAVRAADDPAVARIIRAVMPEFACSGPGFAIHDAEVDCISKAYPGGDARYYVVERGGEVLGGGGFGRLAGSAQEERTCELRKMYFLPELRGLGAGRELLARLLAEMKEAGYRRCYLETTRQMTVAQALYRKLGFTPLPGPLGATGHFGCDRFYSKEL
jgi:putative acetyltransferase